MVSMIGNETFDEEENVELPPNEDMGYNMILSRFFTNRRQSYESNSIFKKAKLVLNSDGALP